MPEKLYLPKITAFRGPYYFLSNFYPIHIDFEGIIYQDVESAYQAAKTLDPNEREIIARSVTPGQAKSIGRRVKLRPNWDEIKIDIMRKLLRQKFSYASLRWSLIETKGSELIEGNDWGDNFWGDTNGNGQNWLGKILMELREEFLNE